MRCRASSAYWDAPWARFSRWNAAGCVSALAGARDLELQSACRGRYIIIASLGTAREPSCLFFLTYKTPSTYKPRSQSRFPAVHPNPLRYTVVHTLRSNGRRRRAIAYKTRNFQNTSSWLTLFRRKAGRSMSDGASLSVPYLVLHCSFMQYSPSFDKLQTPLCPSRN